MFGIVGPLLSAISAALAVWRQERALYNSPDIIKNHLDTARQAARDALNSADAVAANPKATAAQHADAIRALRLADS